jgi:HAD superfamily hydrolase (TIGR01490 family)
MNLAIFDFDGTITRKDSFIDFLFFAVNPVITVLKLFLLSPILFLYAIKVLPNWKTKQIVFSVFFRGWSIKQFDQLAQSFAQSGLPKMVKPSAMAKIKWHKEQGDTIVVVSASFMNYLQPWCQSQGLHIISTQIEVQNGQITGRFATPNCYGEEKVRRIQEIYPLSDFKHIYAYEDSGGDDGLKRIAHTFEYRSFK